MHIGLAAQPLFSPRTGIGRYTLDLVTGLTAREPSITVSLVTDFGRLLTWQQYCETSARNESLKSEGQSATLLQWFRSLVAMQPTLSVAHLKSQAKILRYRLSESGLSCFHGPNFFAPYIGLPRVVTIHDLSTIDHPEWHPRARVERTNLAIELSASCDEIITISNFTKRRIVSALNVAPSKVVVTHLYAGDGFAPMNTCDAENKCVLESLGLGYRGYALCVSTIEPRKNIDRLLAAYRLLPASLKAARPLVLAGGYGWKSRQTLALIDAGQREGWLKYVGRLTDRQLLTLTRAAAFAVFPSLYEGFGLPVVEALASGIRVVLADTEVGREVAGDSGYFFRADSVFELVDAVIASSDAVLTDGFISQDSLNRSELFTKEECLKTTIEVYRGTLPTSSVGVCNKSGMRV